MTIMIVKDIKSKVALTAEDRETIKMKANPSGPGVEYNTEQVCETIKEIVFTKAELQFLKSQVDRLDKAESVTEELLELCLKIQGATTGASS